ncbi:inositol monophosphatase family protein [Thermoproteota archaeon]
MKQLLSGRDIEAVDSTLSVPVDKEFLNAWENGPANPESTESIRQSLTALAKVFCDFITQGRGKVKVASKEDPRDFVTDVDTGIEMLFRIWLSRFFPNHKIVGEEGGKDLFSSADVVWYVDPVDGTNNYVSGRNDVALHIGSVYKGKPWVTLVALPFYNKVFSASISSKLSYQLNDETITAKTNLLKGLEGPLVIASEYRQIHKEEEITYHRVLKRLKAKEYRLRSIGVNLMKFLEGGASAFYKPEAKPWDVIAPLAILDLFASDILDVDLYIARDGGVLTRENAEKVSPFTNKKWVVDWLNLQNRFDSRMGFIIVTPKTKPELADIIFEEVVC